jgi:hypothetical protein
VTSGLDWNAVWFISDLGSKVDYLYDLLSELIDIFAPVRTVKVGRSGSLLGIRDWMDSDVEQAVAERNLPYEIRRGDMNRVKGYRNWLAFADRRRIAKSLLDGRRAAFVSINLDPDLPPKMLYSNLRQLGVINGSNKVEVEVDVERMNQFFCDVKFSPVGVVPQPELFIGPDSIEVVPKVRNFGFVLNMNLTPVDHYKAVCQRLYSVLRSVKKHARYTPFGVRMKLAV